MLGVGSGAADDPSVLYESQLKRYADITVQDGNEQSLEDCRRETQQRKWFDVKLRNAVASSGPGKLR